MSSAALRIFGAWVATALCVAAKAETAAERAFRAVDPFIGTGGDGHTFPGATLPFGMIQLSPDTMHGGIQWGYDWCGGYRYNDLSLLGFSHTHFSGAGHADLGDVLLMPFTGETRLDPGDPEKPGSGYRSRYTHDREQAEPGYYAVDLLDHRVRVELTATTRAGVHRYHFPAGEAAHVLLDLRTSIYDYDQKNLWSRLRVRSDGAVTGFRETRGWAMGRHLYFAIRFSQPMAAHALHNTIGTPEYVGTGSTPGGTPAEKVFVHGKRLVAAFDFAAPPGGELLVKVAISSVSEENALHNLDTEMPGWDFDATRAAARTTWSQALGAVELDPATSADAAKMFYTALYHTMLGPTVFSDVDGRYRGPDYEVHAAEGFTFHSTFSLWDTYRAEHPLLTLLQPARRNNDFIRSLLASRRHSPHGILPVWQYHGLENWCMIGYHAVPVIVDAWMKGIRDYPADEALDAMVASATHGAYAGLDRYMRLGYVPIDTEAEAASKTLEYAYDDWTISRFAAALGREKIATQFAARAQNYRNLFDPRSGFMRARQSDGKFKAPFSPLMAEYGGDYTEGNAWHYLFYVPHDVAGLSALLGGDARLIERLEYLFKTSVDPVNLRGVYDLTGLIGLYAHGNEPSHHVAYLYAFAGAPWRTQEWLTRIMATQYRPTPDGLSGNDDLGQMSAWHVFTALGFYPVAPGTNEYVIGRPFLPRAVLHLPNGQTFTVVTENLDADHPWIGAVTLNGRPLERSFLRHEEIVAGGELRFTMRARPNQAWGAERSARPFSASAAP